MSIRSITLYFGGIFSIFDADQKSRLFFFFFFKEGMETRDPHTNSPLLFSAFPQSWMVERYHELDDAVVREIFGKRVASKTRKDLDDVSELTRVPLRSCHRQYDNIRRRVSLRLGVRSHYGVGF